MRNHKALDLKDVSRETSEKLIELEDLVRKWSKVVNLVGPGSLLDFRCRHIDDSIFIASCGRGSGPWLDLGSGAGFPGLVVAILFGEHRAVTLIESDRRKCEFLRAARRELSLHVQVLNGRIEETERQAPCVLSARALAPLPKLLDLSIYHATAATTLLFPKGVNWEAEVDASRCNWRYDLKVIKSPISDGSVVLEISSLSRVSR